VNREVWRKLLVGLIVCATVVFGIAAAFERSDADAHPSGAEPHTEEIGGEETNTDEGVETDEATIFGVNPEATPILLVVVIASLMLAAVVWLRPDWRWLLVVVALGMGIFAVLDIREAVHQFDEATAGLGISALVVAAAHAAAAFVALLLLRQPGAQTAVAT
jgi:hypothetical protein